MLTATLGIADEFLEHMALVRHLIEVDGHFARVFRDYEDLNRLIHILRADIQPAGGLPMVDLRRRRLELKEEICGMLAKHEPDAEKLGE